MTPAEFIAKWRHVSLTDRPAAALLLAWLQKHGASCAIDGAGCPQVDLNGIRRPDAGRGSSARFWRAGGRGERRFPERPAVGRRAQEVGEVWAPQRLARGVLLALDTPEGRRGAVDG